MSKNKYVDGYDILMKFLYEAMDNTLHSIADGLEIAKEKTFELGHLTQDEINKLAEYIENDIEHAAHTLDLGENDTLTEWLKFDIELIENFAIDSLADKTRVELTKLERAAQLNTYHTGDITGPGTFACEQCGKEISFDSTNEIPECPDCSSKTFVRC